MNHLVTHKKRNEKLLEFRVLNFGVFVLFLWLMTCSFLFGWCWWLNPGFHSCQASALLLSFSPSPWDVPDIALSLMFLIMTLSHQEMVELESIYYRKTFISCFLVFGIQTSFTSSLILFTLSVVLDWNKKQTNKKPTKFEYVYYFVWFIKLR